MKRSLIFSSMLILISLASCTPSENKIATAIAETELASPSNTPAPTVTITPSPTFTLTPSPTIPEGCSWEEYETTLTWGFSVLIASMTGAAEDKYHPFDDIQNEISGITNIGMAHILSNFCSNHEEITQHLLDAYMEYIAALEVAKEYDAGLYHPDAAEHFESALESLTLYAELVKMME